MRLLRNSRAYRNGVKYNPATFKKPTADLLTRVDEIELSLLEKGYAIIPLQNRAALLARLRYAGLSITSHKLDNRRVKVTPVKE